MAKKPSLQEELMEAGAAPEEAGELAKLAGNLGKLPAPRPLLPILRTGWGWPGVAGLTVATAAGCLIIGGAIMAAAQTSRPGAALYPVKRLSERMMVDMDPGYADMVMMQRADEIDSLASSHGSMDMVINEVQDYEQILDHAQVDEATRDYCALHLQHAASQTSGNEQQIIQTAVHRLSYED